MKFSEKLWGTGRASVEESAGPTMTAWRRSLVTIPYVVAAGLLTLEVGEFTQILVSAAGSVRSGASPQAGQTAAAARVVVT